MDSYNLVNRGIRMVVLSLASIVRYCFTKLLQKKRWNFYEKKKKGGKDYCNNDDIIIVLQF